MPQHGQAEAERAAQVRTPQSVASKSAEEEEDRVGVAGKIDVQDVHLQGYHRRK